MSDLPASSSRSTGSSPHSDAPNPTSSVPVSLPIRRKPSDLNNTNTQSLWTYTQDDSDNRPASALSNTPTLDKCDKNRRPQAICCRDLKGDDDRHLIDPDIVRDVYA